VPRPLRPPERDYGQFQRSIALPQDVKSDEVSATHNDGVLDIRIPKVEQKQPQRIQVQSQGQGHKQVGTGESKVHAQQVGFDLELVPVVVDVDRRHPALLASGDAEHAVDHAIEVRHLTERAPPYHGHASPPARTRYTRSLREARSSA
jgi:hypothetical protein